MPELTIYFTDRLCKDPCAIDSEQLRHESQRLHYM
jgi:hypothetical protein